MIIVRDADVLPQQASQLANVLGLAVKPSSIGVLNGIDDPLEQIKTNVIVLITAMRRGWLAYHRKFFQVHKADVPIWIVLLTNTDPVIYSQAQSGFQASGVRVYLHAVDPENSCLAQLREEVCTIARIQPHKVLLYSIRPHCGKRTLKALLSESLQDWSFETAEENLTQSPLEKSDAAHIIIVGTILKDFAVTLPRGIQPLYVLTMPDQNVQNYLHRRDLAAQLLRLVPRSWNWTEENATAHLFYISPLYEEWRRINMNPTTAAQFIMWDEFGLPVPRTAYTPERIQAFLAQFNECDILTRTLTSGRGTAK